MSRDRHVPRSRASVKPRVAGIDALYSVLLLTVCVSWVTALLTLNPVAWVVAVVLGLTTVGVQMAMWVSAVGVLTQVGSPSDSDSEVGRD